MARRGRFFCGVSLALIALVIAPVGSAQQKELGETLDVVTVEVPVQVIEDGEPVRGLTIDDFEIVDGRKKQTITGFEVVDLNELTTGDRGEANISASARRHFLLLFDLSFSTPASIVRAREAARELVLEELHPDDLVAVATYSLNQGPRLVLGFTPDRRQVAAAIETLGLPGLLERPVADPLGLLVTDTSTLPGLRSEGSQLAGSEGRGGVDTGALVEEHLRDLSLAYERSSREIQRNRAMAFLSAFEDLARMMKGVQGRKHLVLLSEGFESSVLVGTEDLDTQQVLNVRVATGRFFAVDSEQRFGNTAAINALEQMIEEFRRADTVIQALDVGGLRAGHQAVQRSSSQQSLLAMAAGTGGEVYDNFNDLGEAIQQMLDRTSVTYVLSFQPSDVKLDGDYHRLKVNLEDGPPGARVVHRPGYYAPLPWSERNPLERRLSAADLVAGGTDGGEISSTLLATPFRSGGGRAYVPVMLEIDGRSLLGSKPGDKLGLEVYAYAVAGEDGAIRDFFHHNLGLDLTKVGGLLRSSGLKFYGDLDLPPGSYVIRVLVRDVATGRASLRTQSVTVPRYGDGEPVLLPPLFPEESGKWVLVHPESESEVPYPFTFHGESYVPSAKPEIGSSQMARFYLLAYNLGTGPLLLELSLLDSEGKAVEGPRVSFVERQAPDASGLERLVLALDSSGLAAGEYTLIANLAEATSSTGRASIPFVVEGGAGKS